MSAKPKTHRRIELFFVIAFALMLALPMLDRALRFDPSPPLTENRAAVPRPQPPRNLRELPRFIGEVETYADDRAGMRKTFVRAHNALHYFGLGVSPTPQVIIGCEGWLFYGARRPYYRRDKQLDESAMARLKRIFDERRAWLAERGIAYVVVFVPLKGTIYPEYLPETLRRRRPESAFDGFMAYLETHGDWQPVDLRAAMREAKDVHAHPLYTRTDSHWNDLGAYIGYRETMRVAAAGLEGASATPLSAYTIREATTPRDRMGLLDLARMMSLGDLIDDAYIELVPDQPRRAVRHELPPVQDAPPGAFAGAFYTEIDDPALPAAVITRDSFGEQLAPFLSEHFRRAVYHPLANRFPAALIEAEKPDIVIAELVEDYLLEPFPDSEI